MKTLFLILAVIAVLVLLGGALNHSTQLSLDYLVGSTPGISIFWFALGVGAGLLFAGLAGWSVGRAGSGDARAKLERELESTYRRLRECEAKLPLPAAPATSAAEAPAAEATAMDAVTAVAAAAPDEAVTAVAAAAPEEAVTVADPAASTEAATDVVPAPVVEADTVVTADDGEAETTVTEAPGTEEAPAS